MEALFKQMEDFAKENKVPIINENGRKVFIEIIKKYKPQKVLEIGTAIGYSALLTTYYGAENAKIISLELDEERAKQAQDFINQSAYREQIKIILGDAAKNIEKLDKNYKFDMVFIDAAKGQYPDYLQKVLPLLADDGIILADNVLFRGYVMSEEKPPRRYKTIVKRLREYIAMVSDTDKFTTEIFENGDGLALTKRLKTN
ncbi:O-methyltransferase [Megamonas funiformis]|uniref:tRNA 5-hydroxyuridine methyltransferase n=3 Tax=Megamonas funiformis TaxID=437897 RepID=A0AAW4U7X3_9FIRM|nr:O-methyltransferase [Megamonas funiformis]MCB6829181.1 O-methyltransferase [Megamonas funiformis]